MKIRFGYDISYTLPQRTPMIMTLNVHSTLAERLLLPDRIQTQPQVALTGYHDAFGNWITRLVAPAGDFRVFADAEIEDSGERDVIDRDAEQLAVEDLPTEVLVYLLGSRYCETDALVEDAWELFDSAPFGWQRVQAICDFVHQHVRFGYEFARPTKTAADVFKEKAGVCRDYTHLAVTLCRCMNLPARYCTGYVTDAENALAEPEPDFAAWFEAYLDGSWYTFDPRNNQRLVGRILMARGRDAADVAISNAFGPNDLKSFRVYAEAQ